MKRSAFTISVFFAAVILVPLSLPFLSQCTHNTAPATGKDQLVAALDAAYVHFAPEPVAAGLRTIDTGIVSGVLFWVA